MSDALDQFETNNQATKLPAFLKVLCILTFIGSGMGILGALMNLVLFSASTNILRTANDLSDGLYDRMGMDIDQMVRWTTYSNYANLLGSILCLTGALLMWKLKKTGFFLYIPGNLIPLITSFIAMEYVMGSGPFAFFGMAGIFFSAIFYIGFIVMYGVNYKHLR